MNRSIVFRIVMALVLIGAICALGAFAYNAGMMQGLAQSVQVEAGKPLVAPYPMYVMPYGMPFWFGGFGLSGLIVLFIVLFVFFGILRAIFWHGPRGWRHMHGPWGNLDEAVKSEWRNAVPPLFEEWHRRSHESQPSATPDKM